MTLKAGNIIEGTVVNITNFGAFVEVEGKTGLVHISEISDTFVKDIREYLKEKDKVRVKVLSIDDNGRISLSIKQAQPIQKSTRPIEIDWSAAKEKANQGSFEDRLSKFMKESDERFQEIKKHEEGKSRGYRKSSSY